MATKVQTATDTDTAGIGNKKNILQWRLFVQISVFYVFCETRCGCYLDFFLIS
jgi:hypothetical protein